VTCGVSRRTVAARLDAGARGLAALDFATLLATARRDRARVRVLPSPAAAHDELFALASQAVPVIRSRGLAAFPCALRWWLESARTAARERVAAGTQSFWHELYIELRRRAGKDKLPMPVREPLRRTAQRAFARAGAVSTAAVPAFQRRLLREPVPVQLPASRRAEAQAAAVAAGIPPGTQLAALEVRTRTAPFAAALRFLHANGYSVVRIGDTAAGPIRHDGVVDLSRAAACTPLLELFVMLESTFVVCESADMQRLAYLTNTPCLLLNATDAVASYPVRGNGLFTLRTAVDLDTGALLGPGDLLSERYYRNVRNYGFRTTSAPELLAAVSEMHDGVRRGWQETEAQAQFRTRATKAGIELARRLEQIARWGTDGGFLGDGRLAAVQAERAS
jgi:putative glycosyltransferase (TIGR04372 family)